MNLQLFQYLVLGAWGVTLGAWAYVVYLIHHKE